MQRRIVRRDCPDLSGWDSSIPPLLQRIYAARGVKDAAQLDYSLRSLVPPSRLQGVERAAELLQEAIDAQQSILILGDFDADGATSTAVAMLGLQMLGAGKLAFRVPSRFADGYGLSAGIIDRLREEGALPDVLVTVDNGISAVEGVAAAREAGCRVIVTDHHLPGEQLPAADAIVNPNQPGCEFLSKHAAGVGVMFYVLTVLRRRLRDVGRFEQGREPNLAELLDLVALGTVADVVPLDHNNRILVAQGLRRIRQGQTRPGIKALLEVAGRKLDSLTSTDLGFVIGPRLNAAGRLDDMSLGIACLLADREDAAMELAVELDRLNRERRSIEQEMRLQAEENLQQLHLSGKNLPWGLCLYEPEWHQGVIGILAARVREQVHRPVIAFAAADEDEQEIKGSARSIPGVHIRDVLARVDARQPGLLLKYGGHAMAAGMTLKRADFDRFAKAFDEAVREYASEDDLQATIHTDGELTEAELNLATARVLQKAGPWGQHFPEPQFDGPFEIINQRIVGERHLKLLLRPPQGEVLVDAIAFNVDTRVWPNHRCERVHLAYKLDVNEFRGRESVQLKVDYLEPL
ncbi:single-stranded-DNA-specific exonuclease RecJ [Marinobacteraceae bacterium S3BR75-40.1]